MTVGGDLEVEIIEEKKKKRKQGREGREEEEEQMVNHRTPRIFKIFQ